MNSLLREDTPYSLRLFIAIVLLVVAWIMWIFIINRVFAITTTTAVLGVCGLLAACLFLGVLGTPGRPFVPLRVSLGLGAGQAALMIPGTLGPRWQDEIVLGAFLFLSLGVIVLANRRPRVAVALSLPLAILGAYAVVVVPITVSNVGQAFPRGGGAGITIVGAACLAGAWHVLRLRQNSGSAGT